MIIWGSRGITSTLEQCHFHCPQCSQPSQGSLKQVKNFFTLYFIPLIPLNVAGRFVECNSCTGTFAEEILRYDPEAEQKETQDQMLRIMILSALADGHVDEFESAEIRKQYQELAGLPMPEQQFQQEIKMAAEASTDLNQYVSIIGGNLSPHGKALVVKLAFHTMSASGELRPGHQTQLAQLGQTLGIPDETYKTLIGQLSEPDPE